MRYLYTNMLIYGKIFSFIRHLPFFNGEIKKEDKKATHPTHHKDPLVILCPTFAISYFPSFQSSSLPMHFRVYA